MNKNHIFVVHKHQGIDKFSNTSDKEIINIKTESVFSNLTLRTN